jgi:hypothetical protein
MGAAFSSTGGALNGRRHSVPGAGGAPICLLTSGVGQALLVVHGGMSQVEAGEPAWNLLSERWQVTAMDRRGRGASGDAESYAIDDVQLPDEIVGLSGEQVMELAAEPRSYDVLAVVAPTLAREARTLMAIDLLADARAVTCPILLMLGECSPSSARDITQELTRQSPLLR